MACCRIGACQPKAPQEMPCTYLGRQQKGMLILENDVYSTSFLRMLYIQLHGDMLRMLSAFENIFCLKIKMLPHSRMLNVDKILRHS